MGVSPQLRQTQIHHFPPPNLDLNICYLSLLKSYFYNREETSILADLSLQAVAVAFAMQRELLMVIMVLVLVVQRTPQVPSCSTLPPPHPFNTSLDSSSTSGNETNSAFLL
jgi:hypothetical protein